MFLFVSPHLDDAALSCGGALRRWSAAGQRVLVATVFTGDVPPGHAISPLARRNHQGWDLPEQPFAARCQEDERALAALGVEALHLGFLDMIYRRDPQGDVLYGKTVVGVGVHPSDRSHFLPELVARLRTLAAQEAGKPNAGTLRVLCPLALGAHVDHCLVREAVEAVFPPEQILYYEDFPYAARSGVLSTWLSTEGADPAWQPVGLTLTPTELAARAAAVACYASQLRGLFPSTLERLREIVRARSGYRLNMPLRLNEARSAQRMEAFLRDYVAQVGGERYWVRRGASGAEIAFVGRPGNVERPSAGS